MSARSGHEGSPGARSAEQGPGRDLRSKRMLVRIGTALVAALFVSMLVSATGHAAAGDLDPTFSGDGRQVSDFGAGPSAASDAVRQADGKIVAVGAADGNFLVARYNLNGSLDTSFSGDGRAQTDFMGFDGATDVALQGNGKIVALGFSTDNNGTARFALARYNPNGSLDTSFSGDGKQTTVVGSFGEAGATGVAIQGDSKIVVVGNTNAGGSHTSQFALARYNPNGSLDISFSGDGKQETGFEGDFAEATAVALQTDGKIVAVGSACCDTFALARYNPNGSLDTTFSGDGKQTSDFVGRATGVALQSDGKIVVVGSDDSDFVLARYNPNGSPDTSFSGDGRQTTDFLFGASDGANDVAIQSSGRIVAVGVAGGGATGNDFALARYNPDGSLDSTFSGDGRRRTNFGGDDRANGVALQGDGRIVAVGAGNGEFAIARYLGS
jgi:uncharacterized delta-60 repeat protein